MADQDEQTYEQWLKANPAPNFAALMARHGSYEAIPRKRGRAFGDAKLEWERRRRRAPPRMGRSRKADYVRSRVRSCASRSVA
jgi:hypothetical protein